MTYLSTTLFLNKLYQEQGPKISLGEDGPSFIDKAISGISDYISSKLKSDNIFGSIMGFMGPGLLWKLGFPWMAIAYEVAGACGIDWAGLWGSLATYVVDLVKSLTSSDKKPTEEEIHKKTSEVVDKAVDEHTSDSNINQPRILELANKSEGVKTSSLNLPIIKEAGIISSIFKTRGILSSLFKKVLPWVITRALISLGLASAVGAASGLLGLHPGTDKKEEESNINKPESESEDPGKRSPIHSLQVSPSVDQDLFKFNDNRSGSIWRESGNVSNIQSMLTIWIHSAYPQLDPDKDKIINSPSFIQVENMFRNENPQSAPSEKSQGIIIFPKPFQKKNEIVSYIINSYLKTRGN